MQFFETPFARFAGGFSLAGNVNFRLLKTVPHFNRQLVDLLFCFRIQSRLQSYDCFRRLRIQFQKLTSNLQNGSTSFNAPGLEFLQFRNLCFENQIFQIHDQAFAEVNS